eukprot:998804-Pyramimonas_sp.AAC.1
MRTAVQLADDDAASDAGSDASFGDAVGAGDEELRGLRKRGQGQVLTPEEQERMGSLIRDRVRARASKRLRTTKGHSHNQFTELLKQAGAMPVEGAASL